MANNQSSFSSAKSRRPQGHSNDGPVPSDGTDSNDPNNAGQVLNYKTRPVPTGNITVLDDAPGAAIFNANLNAGGISVGGGDGTGSSGAVVNVVAAAGTNGYATGNHMYMHCVIDAAAAATFRVYGYNYSSGRWGLLRLPTGGNGNTWNAACDPVEILIANGNPFHVVIPIFGIDRVAFGAATGNDLTRLNGGTFQISFNTF